MVERMSVPGQLAAVPTDSEPAEPAFDYRGLVAAMEHNLLLHGDTFRGAGWTMREDDADLQRRIMLDGIRPEWPRPLRLLDFGCGASHLYEHIQTRGLTGLQYAGLDLSSQYLALCRSKFPDISYYDLDVLDPGVVLPSFDYVILNGVFHYKAEQSHDAAWRYCRQLLSRISAIATRGFAFNVVSPHVDWESDYLFHVPIGTLTDYIASDISRNFTVRHDYGLYEYSVYVYRDTARPDNAMPVHVRNPAA